MPLSGTLSQAARCSTCLCSYACFVSATEKGDGCGGKGGAVTLGLQMGFPQERHAPVFFEMDPSFAFERTVASCFLFMCHDQRPPAGDGEATASLSTRSRLRSLAQRFSSLGYILNLTEKV